MPTQPQTGPCPRRPLSFLFLCLLLSETQRWELEGESRAMVAAGAWAWAGATGSEVAEQVDPTLGPRPFRTVAVVSIRSGREWISHSSAVCTGEGQSPWHSGGPWSVHPIFSGSSPVLGRPGYVRCASIHLVLEQRSQRAQFSCWLPAWRTLYGRAERSLRLAERTALSSGRSGPCSWGHRLHQHMAPSRIEHVDIWHSFRFLTFYFLFRVRKCIHRSQACQYME